MSKGAQTILVHSRSLRHPSSYVQAMYREYSSWIWDEEQSPLFKGHWREKMFKAPLSAPLDLEIGPGSGDFIQHISLLNKDRFYVAMELKYKPLIQCARKIKKHNCLNARLIRYNARLLRDIFCKKELNNVYVYFPDPWPKKRHHKHRLIKPDFLKDLYMIQRPGSFVEIKTDHKEYFDEMQKSFKESPYREQHISLDLHEERKKSMALNKHGEQKKSMVLNRPGEEEKTGDNFVTFFEQIFIRQKHPVCYARYVK